MSQLKFWDVSQRILWSLLRHILETSQWKTKLVIKIYHPHLKVEVLHEDIRRVVLTVEV